MGIGSDYWNDAPWKESLRQHGRKVHACVEYLLSEDEDRVFPYDGNPFATFEHSLVSACFSIRRMSEKRLLTDRLDAAKFKFRCYPAKVDDFRQPQLGSTSSRFYMNYDLDQEQSVELTLRSFASEVIHSSQLGVADGRDGPSSGVVVASDWNLKHRVIHFTIDEWIELCTTIQRDRVTMTEDRWDPESGKVSAKRLGQGDS